jgi:hypothetical protein
MIKKKSVTQNLIAGNNPITHNLGKTPKHIFCWINNKGVNVNIVGRTTTTVTIYSAVPLSNVEIDIIAYT